MFRMLKTFAIALRPSPWRSRTVCALLLATLLALPPVYGQEVSGIAARARIVNPGVTFILADTPTPLALREGAVFPLSDGDVVETDDGGRVLIEFADSVQMLLLPFSRLEVLRNQVEQDGESILYLRLDGQSVQRVQPLSSGVVELGITLGASGSVYSQDGWFAAWSDIDNAAVVTVAEGGAVYEDGVPTYDLEVGDALYDSAGVTQVYPMTLPYNAARLIGDLFSCEGVSAAEGEGLNVRAGAGGSFQAIAKITDGTPLRIMGVTEDGSRYRIQFLTGFGWVLAFGADTECQPPVYPNGFAELNLELKDVEDIEYALLPPFFGTPAENFWFWRWPEG